MGFNLLEKKYLKNIDTNAYLYEHKKTKAQLIFFKNEDVNKSFSITFKTLPYNDNGIFHILEHSVLCGSEKYPVKEPFVELIKGSFNTFINAMTFSDKTIYPVSSKNEEDLKLLMDIYLDAVFNPNLLYNENILKQEGWHYHLENKEDKLVYKGVVYNEMKGVYSSVDEILDMNISESLFRDTIYKFSSGGKPSKITTLTQKEFVNTHKKCYHPSNSYIFLYGDLEIDSYLEHIDSYLNNYEYVDYSEYKVECQNNFYKEDYNKTYYNENPKDKNYVAINYIIGKNKDINIINSIDVIDEVLLGNSNTEFRKYFIDNNICEDVYSYPHKERLEVVYSIIFKNVKNNYVDSISSLYEKKLKDIINKKFDDEQIQSTINKNIFIIKEESNKISSPKGVNYAIRSLRNWLYGENPFDIFDYDKIINNLKQNLEKNEYEKIAKKYLIDNYKKSIVKLTATDEIIESDDLTTYQNNLSDKEINKIIDDTKNLLTWQNSKDNKKDLEKIKSVDAQKVIIKKPYNYTNFEFINNIKYAHYNTNTNNILYSKLLFDITNFSKEELEYTSLLTYLLFNINTKLKNELEIAKEIDFHLGSINSNINILKNDSDNSIKIKFILSSKNLIEKTDKLIEIITENTLNTDFSNKQSIYNIILELKLMLESRFKNAGHSFVNKRVSSYYSLENKISEYISGYDFYIFISNIVNNFEKEYNKLTNHLEKIIKLIFNKNNLLISCIGNIENYNQFKKHILNYVNLLPSKAILKENTVINFKKKEDNFAEGYFFDTLVQYVGIGYNIDQYSGQMLVLRHILNFDYLWNNVRVKGGAYGAGITINKYGDIGLWSYRDPNLLNTLQTYFSISDYIKNINLDDITLNKYIIGTLNSFDQLMSPNEKGTSSLIEHITNSNPNNFNRLVCEIKKTTVKDLQLLAELFDKNINNCYKCIIGSKELIEKNKNLFKNIIEIK